MKEELPSKLPPWATGASSHWGSLGDGVGQMPQSYPTKSKGAGVFTHQLWPVIGSGLLLLGWGGMSLIAIKCPVLPLVSQAQEERP